MPTGRLAVVIVALIIVAIIAFVVIRPSNTSQHGQPSPHALDQSQ